MGIRDGGRQQASVFGPGSYHGRDESGRDRFDAVQRCKGQPFQSTSTHESTMKTSVKRPMFFMIGGVSCLISLDVVHDQRHVLHVCDGHDWHFCKLCIFPTTTILVILVKPFMQHVILTCRATTDMNEKEEEEEDDDGGKAFPYHCLCFFELESLVYVVYEQNSAL